MANGEEARATKEKGSFMKIEATNTNAPNGRDTRNKSIKYFSSGQVAAILAVLIPALSGVLIAYITYVIPAKLKAGAEKAVDEVIGEDLKRIDTVVSKVDEAQGQLESLEKANRDSGFWAFAGVWAVSDRVPDVLRSSTVLSLQPRKRRGFDDGPSVRIPVDGIYRVEATVGLADGPAGSGGLEIRQNGISIAATWGPLRNGTTSVSALVFAKKGQVIEFLINPASGSEMHLHRAEHQTYFVVSSVWLGGALDEPGT